MVSNSAPLAVSTRERGFCFLRNILVADFSRRLSRAPRTHHAGAVVTPRENQASVRSRVVGSPLTQQAGA